MYVVESNYNVACDVAWKFCGSWILKVGKNFVLRIGRNFSLEAQLFFSFQIKQSNINKEENVLLSTFIFGWFYFSFSVVLCGILFTFLKDTFYIFEEYFTAYDFWKTPKSFKKETLSRVRNFHSPKGSKFCNFFSGSS